MRAVLKHTEQAWVVLYVQRWLEAPMQREDGSLVARDRGSPQGSAISPLLANLFMHYAFDSWMRREFPAIGFERYCDDAVVHCRSEQQARYVREAIAKRLADCRLELNAEKTRIAYCKDELRKGSHEHERFDILGYRFRPRLSKSKAGKHFVDLARMFNVIVQGWINNTEALSMSLLSAEGISGGRDDGRTSLPWAI